MKKSILFITSMLLIILIVGCDFGSNYNTSETYVNSTNQTTISNLDDPTSILSDFTFSNEILDSNGNAVEPLTSPLTVITTGTYTNDGTTITLTSSGTFTLSGKLDGQVIVDIPDTDEVTIELKGVEISSSKNAAIYAKSADKTTIKIIDGTVNILKDATSYTYDDITNEEPNACLFSKNDLTIKGSGILYVFGNFNNGIGTKDDLNIKNGNIHIAAVNNAIKGNESIDIEDASITVTSCETALKVDDASDEGKGSINITSGNFTLNSSSDSIEAALDVNIFGGTFAIITNGGSANGPSHNSTLRGGGFPGRPSITTTAPITTTSTTDSYKAIKAKNDITILDGSFTINSADDSIHANNVTIAGGVINTSSGDDGIHADTLLTISAGIINITKSYEGLESSNIIINGGTIRIVASDDGINVAGGNDSSSGFTPPSYSANSNYYLKITGGYVYLNASGDGLDSNGSIQITGGTAIVEGPTDNGNGPLDYDSTCTMTGGTLLAIGSSGMAQNVSLATNQASILFTFSRISDQVVSISKLDGSEIIAFKPTKTISSILICTAGLTTQSTYNIYFGGSHSGTLSDCVYSSGDYTVGTLIKQFTLIANTTKISL